MKITKAEIKLLLKEMEEIGIDELEMDIDTEYKDHVYSVDFDVWRNGRFAVTLLSIE